MSELAFTFSPPSTPRFPPFFPLHLEGILPSKSTDHHGPDHHITRSTQDQSPVEDGQCDESGEPEEAG